MTPFRSDNSKIKKQVVIDNNTLNVTLVIIAAIIFLLIATLIYFIVAGVSSTGSDLGSNLPGGDIQASGDGSYPFKQSIEITVPTVDNDTELITTIHSDFAALIDMTDNKIIASKSSSGELYPASMTKVMTLIVVFENLKSEDSLNDTITVTQEYLDKKIADEHSGDLCNVGEVLTVKDMIYNLILKSDGIAALSLADYIAGSEKAFVELMNAKAAEIGLERTQFSNCSGIHEKYHLTTARDMATIMTYAMNNTFCAEVLSALSYRTTTNVYPDGITAYHSILVSKLHNDMAAQKISPNTVDVLAAKSGWSGDESGHCLVTYAVGKNGHKYVLVTAKAETSTEAIEDMLEIYNTYVK